MSREEKTHWDLIVELQQNPQDYEPSEIAEMMFTIEEGIIKQFLPQPNIEIDKLFKTKYVGHGDGGKLLLAYSDEQINTIKQHVTNQCVRIEQLIIGGDKYLKERNIAHAKLSKIAKVAYSLNPQRDDNFFKHIYAGGKWCKIIKIVKE